MVCWLLWCRGEARREEVIAPEREAAQARKAREQGIDHRREVARAVEGERVRVLAETCGPRRDGEKLRHIEGVDLEVSEEVVAAAREPCAADQRAAGERRLVFARLEGCKDLFDDVVDQLLWEGLGCALHRDCGHCTVTRVTPERKYARLLAL